MFLEQLWVFVVVAGTIGLLTHVVGEHLPREAFDCTQFPYAAFAWEEDGRFYSDRLRIERWKDRLPDASRMFRRMERKAVAFDRSAAHLLRLVRETCVAEAVHWGLLVISPVLLLFMKPPWSWIATVLYGLSNFPFIMIQRYNRPRLLRAMQRAQRLEARKEADA